MDLEGMNILLHRPGADKTEAVPLDDVFEEIRKAIREEVAKAPHTCRFPSLTEDSVAAVGNHVGMMTALGDGNLDAGVELLRENHKWIRQMRLRSERVSVAIILTIVTTMAVGTLSALWLGLKAFLED